MGEIAFQTQPPNAVVRCEVTVEGPTNAGVFLGVGTAAPTMPLELVPSDPRLRGLPENYVRAAPGCYIRAQVGPTGAETELSDGAVKRLRSLGYVGSEGEDDE
jgi:hypothetical protein